MIQGTRYFILFDDAMVGMRYARNLVHGFGLVFNPGGERVEGLTNPLWIFYMAFLHLFPLPIEKISVLVQITGLALVCLTLVLVRQIARKIWNSEEIALGAVFLTAFYLPLNLWSLQGMEVGALTAILTYCILRQLESWQHERVDVLSLLLLVFSTLLRLDMVVPFFAILIFSIYTIRGNYKRVLARSIPALVIFVGIQFWLRYAYYGELLPNTYYLKVAGIPLSTRIGIGAYTLLMFTWKSNWILFLLPLLMMYRHRDKRQFFLGWVFVFQMLYSVYVGGDSWESRGGSNRFISIAMPEFFLLLSWSIYKLCRKFELRRSTVFALLIFLSSLILNSTYGPVALLESAMIAPPAHMEDNRDMVKRAMIIREITTPQAKVAVTWAGTLPYFADRYIVDILGKNDKYIAHLPMRLPNTTMETLATYQAGHMKYDYRYSLLTLNPDVVAQLWKNQQEALPILDQTSKRVILGGYVMFLQKDSPNILWDKVKALESAPNVER